MAICRTLDEVRAAALADAANDPPLTQDQADLVAAILAGTPEQEGFPVICRTVEEIRAAGKAAAADALPPLTQDQADLVAAILAASRTAEAVSA